MPAVWKHIAGFSCFGVANTPIVLHNEDMATTTPATLTETIKAARRIMIEAQPSGTLTGDPRHNTIGPIALPQAPGTPDQLQITYATAKEILTKVGEGLGYTLGEILWADLNDLAAVIPPVTLETPAILTQGPPNAYQQATVLQQNDYAPTQPIATIDCRRAIDMCA